MRAALAIGFLTLIAAARAEGQTFPVSIVVSPARIGPPAVDVTLRLHPPIDGSLEMARLVRSATGDRWQLEDLTVRRAVNDGFAVGGRPGADTLVVIRSPDHPGYVLYGPLRWPLQPETVSVNVQWRRTVRGRLSEASAPPTWIDASRDRSEGPWPVCSLINRTDWECVGVPLDAAGVAVAMEAGRVQYALAPGAVAPAGVETVATATARWARLVVIDTTGASPLFDAPEPGAVRVSARRVRTPRLRPQALRVDVEMDDRVRIEKVGARLYWASGTSDSHGGWIEIAGSGLATSRLEVAEVVAGPVEVPLRVLPSPALVLHGIVSRTSGVSVANAMVTLFRLAAEPAEQDERNAKRIFVAERTTNDEGVFGFDGLSPERYELVALHPIHGRAELRIVPGGQEIDLRLRARSHAIGRIVREGLGVPGLAVAVVPALTDYASSRDVTELRGGETTTDRDGRFNVVLAERGTGEVRIGDERSGVRRIPLPPAQVQPPLVDLGTISLDPLPSTTFVLEGSDGCELLLTGPAGRAGMTIVRPTRIGPAMFEAAMPEDGAWHVVAICRRSERAVVPPIVAIAPGARDQTIRLMWP